MRMQISSFCHGKASQDLGNSASAFCKATIWAKQGRPRSRGHTLAEDGGSPSCRGGPSFGEAALSAPQRRRKEKEL